MHLDGAITFLIKEQTSVGQLFEFCYNLQFHVLKIFRIKEPLVPGYWKLEVLKIFRIKEPPIPGLWWKFSEKDIITSSSGIFWKFSKHPVSFMKELTKNLQFRAGSLTGSLVSWGPGLRVVPSSQIFWESLVKGPDTWPLPTGSFFEKERTTKHWNILYTWNCGAMCKKFAPWPISTMTWQDAIKDLWSRGHWPLCQLRSLIWTLELNSKPVPSKIATPFWSNPLL